MDRRRRLGEVIFLEENSRSSRASLWLLGIGIAFLIGGLIVLWNEVPSADPISAPSAGLVAPGCKQAQTIAYARCGHEVVRRIDAPAGWIGMTKEAVGATMDSEWRMTAFAPEVIEMSRVEDMFCPQHWVLALGLDGTPGVYRNRYGFSMERLSDVSLGALDEATRESLTRGIAFDTQEELEKWVAGSNRQ